MGINERFVVQQEIRARDLYVIVVVYELDLG